MAADRPLTAGEIALARGVFGDAIDYRAVRIRKRKWAFFQPRGVAMAPMGHVHFHPGGDLYRDDFSLPDPGGGDATIRVQGVFIHELTHVWQAQTRGRWYLALMRHPFAAYSYALRPGWPLARYGLEQQAEIVRHFWLLQQGRTVAGAPSLEAYRAIMPPGFGQPGAAGRAAPPRRARRKGLAKAFLFGLCSGDDPDRRPRPGGRARRRPRHRRAARLAVRGAAGGGARRRARRAGRTLQGGDHRP